ncbi:MAG: aspartate kinase [Holosporales bacterium]|jgi:aspartate kinase|nr:aspartate kinase [Holosporales bacterium]
MMSLYVLKFGGSSVATLARIKHVAEIITEFVKKGNRVAVVTSAMYGVTNHLIDLTKSFSDSSFNREYDAVISAGEQIAAGLLAMCLNSVNVRAKSMNAWQIPIEVTGEFSNAEISNINTEPIMEEIDKGIVPVITGFQGISRLGDIHTIGRGGSDATACFVSSAIKADECFIYTDVDGVYSADPRVVLSSKKIPEISYDEMVELASFGSKVLQAKSALIAKQCEVNLRILSSFSIGEGTRITKKTEYVSKYNIAGIAHNSNMFLIKFENGNIHKKVFEKTKQFNPIALETGSLLFNKLFQNEIKAILSLLPHSSGFDNDIGVVTMIGKEVSKDDSIIEFIRLEIEKKHINLKELSSSGMSVSFVVPFQQTEFFINLLHQCLFER